MIVCNECGSEVETGMRFCSECGAAAALSSAIPTPLSRPPSPQISPPISPPPPSRDGDGRLAAGAASAPDHGRESYAAPSPGAAEQAITGALQGPSTAGGSKALVGILGGVAVAAIGIAFYFAFSDSQASRVASSLRSTVNNGRLVTLTNDDAYTYYLQLKGLDPSNKALAETGAKVLPRLKEMGDEVFRKKVTVQTDRLFDQDWSRTLRVYEWSYAIDPKDRMLEARLRFCEAEVAKSQGKKDAAERGFSAASQIAAAWALPVNSLGLLRTESKRWADSIPYYQRAIQLEPNWEIPYNNMGSAYLGQKDYATSESWYRRALDINPNWARPHWHIGSIYEATNRHSEALSEYQTALNLDPNGYSIDLTAAQKKIDWLQRKLQR